MLPWLPQLTGLCTAIQSMDGSINQSINWTANGLRRVQRRWQTPCIRGRRSFNERDNQMLFCLNITSFSSPSLDRQPLSASECKPRRMTERRQWRPVWHSLFSVFTLWPSVTLRTWLTCRQNTIWMSLLVIRFVLVQPHAPTNFESFTSNKYKKPSCR